jgi:uncharacterized metal-binding protein YceD (DUF177 family)
VRCLADAELDCRSVGASTATKSGDEELRSPYVISDETVDLSAWAHDTIALALPTRSSAAGAGLSRCGKDLNKPHVHEAPAPDSRWAALEALRSADDASSPL